MHLIKRTIGDRFNIILWAVPVSRRAVGRSENPDDETQFKASWRIRFCFYFWFPCQNLEGLLPPFCTPVSTALRRLELRRTTSDWQKRIEAIATQSTVMSSFFFQWSLIFPPVQVSFLPVHNFLFQLPRKEECKQKFDILPSTMYWSLSKIQQFHAHCSILHTLESFSC